MKASSNLPQGIHPAPPGLPCCYRSPGTMRKTHTFVHETIKTEHQKLSHKGSQEKTDTFSTLRLGGVSVKRGLFRVDCANTNVFW